MMYTSKSRNLGRMMAYVLLGLVLASPGCAANAQARYSDSAEYQRMITEIRSAAPSPAYIATGNRPQADAHLSVQVDERGDNLRLTTDAAELSLERFSGRLKVNDRKSGKSWTLSLLTETGCPAGDSQHLEAGNITRQEDTWRIQLNTPCGTQKVELTLLTSGLARLTMDEAEVKSATRSASSVSKTLQLHVDGGGPFFGLGERFWQAGLQGTSLDVRPQDRYGEPGHNWTYVAIPFVYTPGGLGVYADTAFDTNFRFDQTDSSFDLKIAGAPVTLYLFVEPDPKAVLSAYTAITGRPQDPPMWTFGPWITALQGKGAVLDVAHRIRVEGMPASALWIYDQNDEADNLGWPFWFASYYGDPRTFVNTLHGQGFKVLTYVHPYVRAKLLPYNTSSPAYQKGLADNLLVTGADGKPAGPRFELVPVGNIDFTNPLAVDWWQTMITRAVREQGFDGWMEDFGEWVRDSDRFAAGTGRTLSELYPLLYHKITLRIAQALNPGVVPFARSGSPGSQQFSPALWGADQSPNTSRDYGLPSVVTAGITAGMSGFSTWGPDILSIGSNKALWTLWVEFGALSPVMRDHVWDKPEHSFNLWSDAETTATFRRWAAFHSSLLPYFATYAAEAHRTGVPIMRHTVLEYPDDPRSATAEYQYFLGHEMLVAPVLQPGAAMRTLYLPQGEWINFWNGDFLTGGQDVTVQADPIPILMRAGSILPFKPEEEAGHWNWDDPQLLASSLIWKAYPSQTGAAESTFTLPNGTGARFKQQGSIVTIEGISRTIRDYEIVVRTKSAPTGMQLNGKKFPEFAPASGDHPVAQWWWNPSSSEAHMIFRAADFQLQLEGEVPTQY